MANFLEAKGSQIQRGLDVVEDLFENVKTEIMKLGFTSIADLPRNWMTIAKNAMDVLGGNVSEIFHSLTSKLGSIPSSLMALFRKPEPGSSSETVGTIVPPSLSERLDVVGEKMDSIGEMVSVVNRFAPFLVGDGSEDSTGFLNLPWVRRLMGVSHE